MADDGLSIYDEIEIEDMTFDEALQTYHYPCPCGDRFQIALDDLRDEQDIAVCPSCSLMIRVIFDLVRYLKDISEDERFANVASGRLTQASSYRQRWWPDTRRCLEPSPYPSFPRQRLGSFAKDSEMLHYLSAYSVHGTATAALNRLFGLTNQCRM